jgi:hypothetical protein
MLQTFADQAVIATENTRLFEAEQAGKRELQESLDYQTATSEVLSVISRSPTNVQSVRLSSAQRFRLDAIVSPKNQCSATNAPKGAPLPPATADTL